MGKFLGTLHKELVLFLLIFMLDLTVNLISELQHKFNNSTRSTINVRKENTILYNSKVPKNYSIL